MSGLKRVSRWQGYRALSGIAYIIVCGLTVALTGCGGGGATGGVSGGMSTGSSPVPMLTRDSRSTLTTAQGSAFTPNYAAVLAPQARWATNTLRVYVPNPADAGVAQQAMQRWEEATGGLFRLTLTDQSAGAQITFSRVAQSEFDPNIIGRTNYTYNKDNQQMTSATIRISGEISEIHQAQVAVHELGHALGIQGHSDQGADIMYATVPDETSISSRDLNTLFWIYRDGPVAASAGRATPELVTVTVDCPNVP